MNVLLDTNVILDFFLERDPFFQAANELFEAIATRQIEGFMTASSATDIFYICKKQTQSVAEAKRIVTSTLGVLQVCSVDRSHLEAAIHSSMVDFEDAVQAACAVQQQLDAIVTRNPRDFQVFGLSILTVTQLLAQLG